MESDTLLDAARSVAKLAKTPYSNFPVGAAVEANDRKIYSGCNIESASYPLTMCAERVAIFNAISNGAKPLQMALSCLRGDPGDPNSLMPCGACRQVMMDQMGLDAFVFVDGVGKFTVGQLLPKGFRLPGAPQQASH